MDKTDADLDGAESEHWIAVYKPGLTALVKELDELRFYKYSISRTFDKLFASWKDDKRKQQP